MAAKAEQKLNVYATTHINSRTVCEAFAAGAEAPILPPAPLKPGDVFMYGCLRGLQPTLRQAQAENRNWYYADNGYFRPGHYSGYYRVTKNAYQHDGQGNSDGARFKALGVGLKPWRTSGEHIVICPPGSIWCALMGLDHEKWLNETIATIRQQTARPLRIRYKHSTPSLEQDLVNAWALVTLSSNAAVDAILAGIPVICTTYCAAQKIGGKLTEIENLPTPDREKWAGVLADNQWTLDEMKKGVAWAKLKAH